MSEGVRDSLSKARETKTLLPNSGCNDALQEETGVGLIKEPP